MATKANLPTGDDRRRRRIDERAGPPAGMPADEEHTRATVDWHGPLGDEGHKRPVDRKREEAIQRAERFSKLNERLRPLAEEGLQEFIREVMNEAIKIAEEYAQTALAYGFASSAITGPLEETKAETVEWLRLGGYKDLATWIDQLPSDTTVEGLTTLKLAKALKRHVDGMQGVMDDGTVWVTGAHPQMAGELIRLLRSFHISEAIEQEIDLEPSLGITLVDTFRQDLDRVLIPKVVNYDLLNFTVQETATQLMYLQERTGPLQLHNLPKLTRYAASASSQPIVINMAEDSDLYLTTDGNVGVFHGDVYADHLTLGDSTTNATLTSQC